MPPPQDPCRTEFTGSWESTQSMTDYSLWSTRSAAVLVNGRVGFRRTVLADAKPRLGSSGEEQFVLSPSRTGSSSVRACRRNALVEACLGLLEQTTFSGQGLRGRCGVVHNSGSCRVQIGCCGIQPGISLKQSD